MFNYCIRLIKFLVKLPNDPVRREIKSQVTRSGTSIGANYCEADDAESRNDYVHKVGIAKKEARETMYWTKMLVEAEPKLKNEALVIYQEAKEINLIMNAIIKKVVTNNTKTPP